MPKKAKIILSRHSLGSRRPGSRGPSEGRASRPPLARMMKIHEMLAAGGLPNCTRLAGEFEVSYKTVQRDIDFMRDQLMLPIDYDQARHGFHYTKPVAQFPLVTVSHGELVALLVAQKAVEQYRGTPFEKPLRAAFDKLASSLDTETNISLNELARAVSFRPTGLPAQELRAFKNIATALSERRVIEFEYLGLKQEAPEGRRVEPLHLTCIENQWYLIAHDQMKNARRTFALTRIRRVRTLKQQARSASDFSVGKMLDDSFSAFETSSAEDVHIRFTGYAARLVIERKWHKSQRLTQRRDGSVDLIMKVGIAPDLEKWIMSWGPAARVVAPASLRQSIANQLALAASHYQK
jgi:predicted DNA-binding transcriptional regulator YafY